MTGTGQGGEAIQELGGFRGLLKESWIACCPRASFALVICSVMGFAIHPYSFIYISIQRLELSLSIHTEISNFVFH